MPPFKYLDWSVAVIEINNTICFFFVAKSLHDLVFVEVDKNISFRLRWSIFLINEDLRFSARIGRKRTCYAQYISAGLNNFFWKNLFKFRFWKIVCFRSRKMGPK